MAFDEKVLYLRLSPEFGGTRFGHFEQRVVRLGSDPGCDIAIAQGFGVAPDHAQVIFDGPNNIIIAPADRAADVYLWKPSAPRPELVSTPTAIRPGESFALATPNGPRFIVELDELPAEVKAARERFGGPKIGGRKLTGKAMADEVKRQAWTTLLVTKPAQMAQRAVIFVKSGAILQPRNIILGLTMFGGYIVGGASFCTARKSASQLVSAQAKVKSCEENLSTATGGADDPVKMSFSDLALKIVGSTTVGTALRKDKEFRDVVKERTKAILQDSASYAWMYGSGNNRANVFVRWREKLEGNDKLNGDMVRLVAWTVAPPGAKPLSEPHYRRSEDSDSPDACVRGPLQLTYRQALNLGMNVLPDAFHAGSASSIEDNAIRKGLITDVANKLEVELPEELTLNVQAADTSGKSFCVYAEGDDDRDSINKIMPKLRKHFDVSDSDTVPLASSGPGLTARIARWYAADFYTMSFDPSRGVVKGLDFKNKASSTIKPVFDNEGARGEWAIRKAAEIYARAIAVPCIGVLNTEIDGETVAAVLGETNVPSPIYCLVLNYKLTSE